MNFKQFKELEKECKQSIAYNDCMRQILGRLCLMIQCKNVAIDNHKRYLREMNAWEKNYEKRIRNMLRRSELMISKEQQ